MGDSELFEAVANFEKRYHDDLADWVVSKSSFQDEVSNSIPTLLFT